MKTTSVALGTYFENFIQSTIAQGRYNNASEVVRAGLRLLEEQESKVVALKSAIDEGVRSGIAVGFDPQQHLRTLKTQRKNGCSSFLEQGCRRPYRYLELYDRNMV